MSAVVVPFVRPVPARDPVNPAACGLYPVYRFNETNHCPGCGRTHWLIGRLTAECAFCAHALPLQESEPSALPRPKLIRRSVADHFPLEGR